MVDFVDPCKVVVRKSAFSKLKTKKKKELKKNHKKERRKEIRAHINLILSHVNHTFSILDFRIEAQVLRHIHCTFKKNVFFNVKKGPIQGLICFIVP